MWQRLLTDLVCREVMSSHGSSMSGATQWTSQRPPRVASESGLCSGDGPALATGHPNLNYPAQRTVT